AEMNEVTVERKGCDAPEHKDAGCERILPEMLDKTENKMNDSITMHETFKAHYMTIEDYQSDKTAVSNTALSHGHSSKNNYNNPTSGISELAEERKKKTLSDEISTAYPLPTETAGPHEKLEERPISTPEHSNFVDH